MCTGSGWAGRPFNVSTRSTVRMIHPNGERLASFTAGFTKTYRAVPGSVRYRAIDNRNPPGAELFR